MYLKQLIYGLGQLVRLDHQTIKSSCLGMGRSVRVARRAALPDHEEA